MITWKRYVKLSRKEFASAQCSQWDIELIEVTADGFVRVRLMGACATCHGAQQTINEVVETALRAVYPEMQGVIAEHQVSEDLINQALKILRKDKA